MGDPSSLTQILWSDDPATRRALWTILALVVPIALAVFLPPIVRVTRLFFLERRLRDTLDEYESKGKAAQRGALREWLRDSALTRQFAEFERRWTIAQLSEGTGRAPIRLLDVLEDQPLLPIGPRRSLLPVLPGLFLGIGVFGALFGLIPGVTQLGGAAGDAGADAGAIATGAIDPLAQQLGLALRATAWGFASAIAASVVGRLVEGSFDARSRGLDEILAHAYEAVSPGELAEITRQTQQKTLDTLGRELTQFAHELNERLERGLQRIEQSSSRAASLVSQEQRGALHTVVQELSLSVRQGVDHHLAELRGALQRAVDYQSSVTNGLSETYERMVENAQMQDRVARTLGESANALDAAARSLRSEIHPVDGTAPAAQTGPRAGSDELELDRLRESEAIAAQIADDLGQALRGFTEQVERIDATMEALRREIHEETRLRKEPPAEPPRPARPAAAVVPSAPPAPATPSRPALQPAASSLPAAAMPAPAASGSQLASPTISPAVSPAVSPVVSPVMAPAAPPPAAQPPAISARPAATAQPPPAHAPAPVQPLPRIESSPPPTTPRREATSVPPAARVETGEADVASVDGPIGRELSLSGFRVGAPRAQGPDPYERLAAGNEPPSNVRHFPTRERELGDELKLSGLLGPSVPRSGPPPAIPPTRPGGSAPRPAPAPERRPEPAQPDEPIDADEQG